MPSRLAGDGCRGCRVHRPDYYGHVSGRSVSIAELKNNLSAYLGRVRRGEEVLVRDRNVPIAKIVPLSATADVDAELAALAAEGKVRLPEARLPRSFWSSPGPRLSSEDVVRVIRAERDER